MSLVNLRKKKNSSYFFFQSPSYLKIPATPQPNLALSNALIKKKKKKEKEKNSEANN